MLGRLCETGARLGEAVSGAVFSENFPNFWENVRRSGFEPATLGKVGADLPLSQVMLVILSNDA